ncbi:HmuY family protein [Chitinophaga skermanii]|nr:HmuY family protein [Chitinophaga skermanii]
MKLYQLIRGEQAACTLQQWCVFSFLFCGILFTACSKSDDPGIDPSPTDTIPTNTGMFHKLIRITNYLPNNKPATDDDPTANLPTAFFSLEDSTGRPLEYAKTNRWDISFSGLYNSLLAPNNGKEPKNPGYGGNGKGGIYLIAKPFEEVVDVPADELMGSNKSYMTDESGAFGSGIGWYCYDWAGTIYGDGSYDKQHVAYAMKNRTIIVRTAKGNYAKIRMISLYKDALDYAQMLRKTPHPYFTFEYVLVPASSKNFDIK